MSLHSIGYLFREGLKSLWKNHTMSIASIGVLIACLLMTGIAGLLSLNISATMQSVEGSNVITVYLASDVPALTAVRIGEDIRKIDNIADCNFIPKDQGLSDVMGNIGGSGELLESFVGDDNPLPDAYEISLVDLSLYDETISAVTAIDGVDSISDYSHIADLLSSLDRVVRYASIGIVAILAVVSLFIISNTVHLLPADGDQHYEVGGRYQWLCPSPLYCGGPDYWHCVRPCFGHHSLLCLRSGGSRGDQSGSLPDGGEYPSLCLVYLRWLCGGRYAVRHAGRHHFHWQISEKAGRERHYIS